CHECGYETPKWLGKCPGCSAWNSLLEESISNKPLRRTAERVAAIPLNQLSAEDSPRFSSGLSEFDRVLGGGIVPGSLILLGGDPGIGKSTLLLQVAGLIAAAGKRVLYLSGEESLQQIRLRASRLGINNDMIFL
ncbi:MAG TPA: DNA repair protein RadA, partial [Syntrophomonas wolfei]|nr:DNA repair protein RadA [Syntrophomonas wolfei]